MMTLLRIVPATPAQIGMTTTQTPVAVGTLCPSTPKPCAVLAEEASTGPQPETTGLNNQGLTPSKTLFKVSEEF